MAVELSPELHRLQEIASAMEANKKGPSRRLDGDAAEALALHPAGEWTRPSLNGQPEFFRRKSDPFGGGRSEWLAPRLTESLDAAMAIMPTEVAAGRILSMAIEDCREATAGESQIAFRLRLPSFVCAAILRSIVAVRQEQNP